MLPLEGVKRAVRPSVYYMPVTRLLCVENTHNRAGGTIYPLDALREISAFAHEAGILVHMDGARLWNACAATGITPKQYAELADSVSVCLSKGLGAPVGSVVAGSAAFIAEARKYRKARAFAEAVADAPGIDVDLDGVQTNIVILSIERSGRSPEDVLSALRKRGVLLSAGNYMGLRAVTHGDVTADEVMEAARALREVMGG
jgi:threonine aldolase